MSTPFTPQIVERERPALMTALGFSTDDLAANQQGALSEMQVYRLALRRRNAIALGVTLLFAAVLIATTLIFLGSQQDSGILTLLGIAVTLCSAALTGVFSRFWLRLSADLRRGEVMVTEGELVRVVKPVTRRVVNTLIRIDDVEVMVTKEAFDAFDHEHPYRLYRTPYTGILLSAERL